MFSAVFVLCVIRGYQVRMTACLSNVKRRENMEKELLELKLTTEQIRSRIYTVRGVQVMLDSDLAMLYGVETKNLNRAMKRNIERFPVQFCFQLSQQELDGLKCQIGRTNIDGRGGRRTLPWVLQNKGYQCFPASSIPIFLSAQISVLCDCL